MRACIDDDEEDEEEVVEKMVAKKKSKKKSTMKMEVCSSLSMNKSAVPDNNRGDEGDLEQRLKDIIMDNEQQEEEKTMSTKGKKAENNIALLDDLLNMAPMTSQAYS